MIGRNQAFFCLFPAPAGQLTKKRCRLKRRDPKNQEVPHIMQNTAISIENLSVRFRGYTVLDDISASIPAGGCTVFVGPNGAGKTTLLLCLLGEVPYTGTIRKSGDFDARVGYVPQDLRRADSTPVTVSEFLALAVSRRPMWLGFGGAVRRVVSDVLAEVDMRDAAERRICDLSGGQLRRVLLAQALIRRPKLLLLDEPAAGVGHIIKYRLYNSH